MIAELQKAFFNIVFYEDGHKYIDTNTGLELVSVTTEKKNYINPFDPTGKITEACAKKEGISVEELKHRWKQIAIEGQRRGTLLHSYCESLAYRKYPIVDMKSFPHMHNLVNQIHNFFDDYRHWITLAVECIVGDEKNAGQFDRLVQDETKGEIYIVDYKFQKSFKGSYGKMMLPPYDQYPDDTLHQYSWQMSRYKSMLEKKGFKIDKTKLVHFNYEDTQYKVYDGVDMVIVD